MVSMSDLKKHLLISQEGWMPPSLFLINVISKRVYSLVRFGLMAILLDRDFSVSSIFYYLNNKSLDLIEENFINALQ